MSIPATSGEVTQWNIAAPNSDTFAANTRNPNEMLVVRDAQQPGLAVIGVVDIMKSLCLIGEGYFKDSDGDLPKQAPTRMATQATHPPTTTSVTTTVIQ